MSRNAGDVLMGVLMLIIGVLALIAVIILLVGLSKQHHRDLSNKPCAEYANTTIKNVPVRCLSYFSEGN